MRIATTVSVKALAAACALALGLAACSGNDTDARDKFAYVERPVEALYQEAVDNMERRRFDEAILFFDEVERQHPYSSWARRAMLMSAFVKYEQTQYEDALADIERFLSIHPGNKDAPYAYYLRAMCHYERIRDVERDQDITRNALEALNDVMRRYPDTEYARDARLKLDMTYDHLAGKEMEVGRFYLRRNQHVAAINRFNNVVDNFQTTSHTEEALHRLVEAYLELGVLPEAQRHAAILGYNYPGGEWYEDTYRLFRSRNLEDVFEAAQEQRTAQVDG
ncbi:outer membrane protein assembly factor BamD [Parvularcula sp. IMCC14364]|uniref:outer membrane protein assembly factor BamD n=1 Tax=Parvularcula sp. IMCC14364 TaxID=3067902 RepID=UPI002741CC14|nr:outer membrane protein assembly factor BamD [Parvularcula sp. IMCC14364]